MTEKQLTFIFMGVIIYVGIGLIVLVLTKDSLKEKGWQREEAILFSSLKGLFWFVLVPLWASTLIRDLGRSVGCLFQTVGRGFVQLARRAFPKKEKPVEIPKAETQERFGPLLINTEVQPANYVPFDSWGGFDAE